MIKMTDVQKPKFVAETDATGQVTHVSLSMPQWNCIPSKGARDPLENVLEASEFHGASQSDISAWLHRNWQS